MAFKVNLFIILSLFISEFVSAQKVYNYSDSIHAFKVETDSILSVDGVNYDFRIKAITVYSKNTYQIIQTIIPPENDFYGSMPKDQIFIIDDFNFDGEMDFMIMQHITAGPNVGYYLDI